ncbi:hypothetical protein G9A89_018672 [Geosiphon pyriformis]|nr:hypothetical protein G9A89_018672 [Geosiphon pyriformis]
MNELAINTFDLTRKKKKTKVDFILDSNKALTSTTDNNKPSKTKVFKNSPKLEPPKIVQKSGPYSVVKDLMKTPAHITFGQLMTHSHNKLTNSKGEQYCMVMEINKEGITIRKQIE